MHKKICFLGLVTAILSIPSAGAADPAIHWEPTLDSAQHQAGQTNRPVLIFFWAPWCAPCRVIGPVVVELAKEYAGRLKVVKVNVDDHPQAPSRYGVRSIPNLVLFKGGQMRDQIVGAVPKAQLVKAIDQVV